MSLRRVERPLPKKPSAWTRVFGTVYAIRCERAQHRWYQRANYLGYIGMYSGKWKERIRQHLYGGGPYHCKPKVWADLVPGYDPTAHTLAEQQLAVEEVIRLGAAYVVWQGRCFYWYVKFRESLAIAMKCPVHNILENKNNPKHIPQWVAEQQRRQRDLLRQSGLLAKTSHRGKSIAGWSFAPNGSVTWYGAEAQRFHDALEMSKGA